MKFSSFYDILHAHTGNEINALPHVHAQINLDLNSVRQQA